MKKISKILLFIGIIFIILYIVKVGGKSMKKDNTISTTKLIKSTEKKAFKENNKPIKRSDGAYYIDDILIVNKTYPLPKDFVPKDTYKDATGLKYCSDCINKDAYKEFEHMKSDALALGLNIWIQSGYRSYELQSELYNNYVSNNGKEKADTFSARPGHSEHQTGLAFDLNTITDDFQYTNEGIWVNENAWKYGFILRYPKGKDSITGYKYESWHLRYVGKALAEKLYNDGDWETLEEYYNLTSTYSD